VGRKGSKGKMQVRSWQKVLWGWTHAKRKEEIEQQIKAEPRDGRPAAWRSRPQRKQKHRERQKAKKSDGRPFSRSYDSPVHSSESPREQDRIKLRTPNSVHTRSQGLRTEGRRRRGQSCRRMLWPTNFNTGIPNRWLGHPPTKEHPPTKKKTSPNTPYQ